MAQQNAIRGVLAANRSSGYSGYKKGKPNHRQVLRVQLAYALTVARSKIPASCFDEFLDWYQRTVPSLVPDLKGADVGFDNLLGSIKKVPKVALATEMVWLAKRLRREIASLNEFRRQADLIETLVSQGKFEESVEAIDGLIAKLGHSYWTVQLRIAMSQVVGGLEAQKQTMESYRGQTRRGLLQFIAYYTSVRNEEKTTWPRYIEMIINAIESLKRRSDLQNYLTYRLSSIWPDSVVDIADILRIEQSNSIYDMYETLVGLMQHVTVSKGLTHLRPAAVAVLAELEGVQDFRLSKLALALGVEGSRTFSFRCAKLPDALFSLDLKVAVQSMPSRREADPDPWLWIYESAVQAHRVPRTRRTRPYDLRPLLSSILRRDADCIRSQGDLQKHGSNLSGLPFARAIRDFAAKLRDTDAETYFGFGRVSLNSRQVGAEDLDLAPDPAEFALAHDFQCDGPTLRAWQHLIFEIDCKEDRSDPQTLARAVRDFRNADVQAVVDELEPLVKIADSNPLRLLGASLLLSAYTANADRPGIVGLIAKEAAANELSPVLLPVAEALEGYDWSNFRPFADELEAGIALDVLWRSTNQDAVATMLRFAFSYQLKRAGVDRPSKFADEPDRYDRKQLIYYLRNVCVPAVMDMCRNFRSSREVTEERQAVLASLKALDPDRSDTYDAEIYSITNRLVIAQGLKIVDASRIHVDTSAISRWALRNIAEDFGRYADLVESKLGSEGDFDEAIRELFAKVGARQSFYTPDDQADAILVDMFWRLRAEFLSNSEYGLDHFLSKRIRHQSFIGLIRSPLEFQNLITTRESEFGPYRRNDMLIDAFELGDDDKAELHKILSAFAEAFDDLLIDIKNTKFQVRSPEAPEGIFDIVVSTQMLFVARSLTADDLGFDQFLDMVYGMFWTALAPSLQVARDTISDGLKSDLSDLFDRLRADVHALAGEDPAFPILSRAMGEVSVEVQRNLDEAAAWFTKPEGQGHGHQFTLQQAIDIAVESARKSHRAFDPKIEVTVIGDFPLQSPDLLLLTDAIFIALDNVKAHCGLRRNVDVCIRCEFDALGMLRLEVVNRVSPSVKTEEAEEKLEGIRRLIAAGRHVKRVRREGGSGFLKLASAVRSTPGGTIEFGFDGDESFRIAVSLRPTKYTVTVAR